MFTVFPSASPPFSTTSPQWIPILTVTLIFSGRNRLNLRSAFCTRIAERTADMGSENRKM